MTSPDITTLKLKLEALPEGRNTRNKVFTPEEDALILEYWPIKTKSQVARLLGAAENTVRNRYQELTKT